MCEITDHQRSGLVSRSGSNFEHANIQPGRDRRFGTEGAVECPHFEQILLVASLLGKDEAEIRSRERFCGLLWSWGEGGMMSHDDKHKTVCACKPLLGELARLYFEAKAAGNIKAVSLTVNPTERSIRAAEKRLAGLKAKVNSAASLKQLCKLLELEPDAALRRAASILDSFCESVTGIERLSSQDSIPTELSDWLMMGDGRYEANQGCQQMPPGRHP